MMYDISTKDDMFGYIHYNGKTGQLGTIGTLCKVVNRELKEDGKQFVTLQGLSRFRVSRVENTLPYLTALVELNYEDNLTEDEAILFQLEREVYDYLKFYIRLINNFPNNLGMASAVKITLNAKHCRPTLTTREIKQLYSSDAYRRSRFSFALANMIMLSHPEASQLLLQTTSVKKRLEAIKEILYQSIKWAEQELLSNKFLSSQKLELIRSTTYGDPFDGDILPQDEEIQQNEDETDEWDISNVQ